MYRNNWTMHKLAIRDGGCAEKKNVDGVHCGGDGVAGD